MSRAVLVSKACDEAATEVTRCASSDPAPVVLLLPNELWRNILARLRHPGALLVASKYLYAEVFSELRRDPSFVATYLRLDTFWEVAKHPLFLLDGEGGSTSEGFQLAVVEALLKSFAPNKKTLLRWAVTNNRADVFTTTCLDMQKRGQKPQLREVLGERYGDWFLLHEACDKRNSADVVQILLDLGGPGIANRSFGWSTARSPLHIVCAQDAEPCEIHRQVDVASLLIRFGANVNIEDINGVTPAHLACKAGKTALVELLLSHGANLASFDVEGYTPVHYACMSGNPQTVEVVLLKLPHAMVYTMHMETTLHVVFRKPALSTLHDKSRLTVIVEMLLGRGVTLNYVNQLDRCGSTAMHLACEVGTTRIAQMLLQHGASLYCKNNNEETPFKLACLSGNTELVKFALQQVVIDLVLQPQLVQLLDTKLLNVACNRGHLGVVQLLLPHLKEHVGGQLLGVQNIYDACCSGNSELVSWVIQHVHTEMGCISDKRVQCCIVEASRSGDPQMLSVLLEAKSAGLIDVDLQLFDDNGMMPIHHACEAGVVQVLIKAGLCVNALDSHGLTPLHYAVAKGKTDVVKVLLEGGAFVNCGDALGVKPMHLARRICNHELVELLMHACIQQQTSMAVLPNTCDDDGWQSSGAVASIRQSSSARINKRLDMHGWLLEDCTHGNYDNVVALIRRGANLNATDKLGRTPLHHAIARGHFMVVELLLNRGARADAPDCFGMTPLHHVCAYGYERSIVGLVCNHSKPDAFHLKDNDGLTPLHHACISARVTNVVKVLGFIDPAFKDAKAVQLLCASFLVCKGVELTLHEAMMLWGVCSAPDANQLKSPLLTFASKDYVRLLRLFLAECITKGGATKQTHKLHRCDVDVANAGLPNHRGVDPCEMLDKETQEDVGSQSLDVSMHGVRPSAAVSCDPSQKYLARIACMLNVNVQSDVDGSTPLHHACALGSVEAVHLLLEHGANTELSDAKQHTPLQKACLGAHMEVVETLLSHNPNIGAAVEEHVVKSLVGESGDVFLDCWSGLHDRCKQGHVRIARLLIKHGAPVDGCDRLGFTPLLTTCASCDKSSAKACAVVRVLIKHGATVHATEPQQRRTALHYAARAGHVDLMRVLLRRGARVDAGDSNDVTPLMWACAHHSDVNTVELLLEYGADAKALDGDFNTALHHTCEKDVPSEQAEGGRARAVERRGQVVLRLLATGFNINARGRFSKTALHLACAIPWNMRMIALLVNNGASTTAIDADWRTPLHNAVAAGVCPDVIELLVQHGAAVNAKTTSNETPLIAAAKPNFEDNVRCLLRLGADPNAKTSSGDTALHHACKHANMPVIQSLLDHHADVNVVNNDNVTPLHLVVVSVADTPSATFSILKLLMRHGAASSLNMQDRFSLTPIYAIRRIWGAQGVQLLLDYGAAE